MPLIRAQQIAQQIHTLQPTKTRATFYKIEQTVVADLEKYRPSQNFKLAQIVRRSEFQLG